MLARGNIMCGVENENRTRISQVCSPQVEQHGIAHRLRFLARNDIVGEKIIQAD